MRPSRISSTEPYWCCLEPVCDETCSGLAATISTFQDAPIRFSRFVGEAWWCNLHLKSSAAFLVDLNVVFVRMMVDCSRTFCWRLRFVALAIKAIAATPYCNAWLWGPNSTTTLDFLSINKKPSQKSGTRQNTSCLCRKLIPYWRESLQIFKSLGYLCTDAVFTAGFGLIQTLKAFLGLQMVVKILHQMRKH